MGRPNKQDNISLEQVEKLSGMGLIDKEIAYLIGISERTIHNYKDKSNGSYWPEFLHALKRGKLTIDKDVAESLYHRAIGYTHPEEKIFCHEGRIIRAATTRHYPPDPTSMIFWLKNRRPDLWRDKQDIDLGLQDSLLDKFKEWTPDEIRAEQARVAGTILRIKGAGETKEADKPA